MALATDETGLVTQLFDYHPYGTELLNESYDPSSSTPYSFTGKEYTEDSGLFYFEARWYDPLIGRFVSEDPLSQQNPQKLIMDPQAFNYYAYSRNNPIKYVDPSGEVAIPIFIAAVVISLVSDFISNIPIANAPDIGQATISEANGGNAMLGFVVGLADPSPAGEIKSITNVVEEVIETVGTKIDNAIDIKTSSAVLNDSGEVRSEIVDWLKSDGSIAPGDGWLWNGKGRPGTTAGNWHNPTTKESLNVDFQHSDPKGPHLGYQNRDGEKFDIDMEGNVIDE